MKLWDEKELINFFWMFPTSEGLYAGFLKTVAHCRKSLFIQKLILRNPLINSFIWRHLGCYIQRQPSKVFPFTGFNESICNVSYFLHSAWFIIKTLVYVRLIVSSVLWKIRFFLLKKSPCYKFNCESRTSARLWKSFRSSLKDGLQESFSSSIKDDL